MHKVVISGFSEGLHAFFKHGDQSQTDRFNDCIDVLQSVFDNHFALGPIKMLGDFNVQLPKSTKLGKGWYE